MAKRIKGRGKTVRGIGEDSLVKCDKHGQIPGYAICVHVFERKASAVHVDRPSKHNPVGGICCADCVGCEDVTKYRLICEGCAMEHGFLNKGEAN